MKTREQRLNNIIGQLEGIKKLLSSEKDCLKILTQLKAVRSAVSSVMDSVVEEQLTTCMSSLDSKDKHLLIKIKKYVKSN